jgi:ABC-type branched-subunit amino acid transport system substrate-binding protein
MMITATGPGNPGYDAIPGAQAAVADVNAAGGVRGHPVKLTVCDTHGNQNQAAACAQQALSTSSILATVGDDDYSGGSPIAGVLGDQMAAIAHKQYTPPDYSGKGVFATDCGGIGISAGMAEWLAKDGSKNMAALVFDNQGGQQVVAFLTSELKVLFPGTKLAPVLIPVTATDMTSYAAQAISKKPDGVLLALPENLTVGSIQQLRAQGYTGRIETPSTVLPSSAIKQLTNVSNLGAVGCYSYSSAGYQSFLAGMKAHEPSASGGDEAVNAWIGVHAFASVMSTSSQPLTRAGVLAAFNAQSALSTDGLTPALNFTKDTSITGFARAFAPTTVNHVVKDGKLADVAPVQFLDILNGKIVG